MSIELFTSIKRFRTKTVCALLLCIALTNCTKKYKFTAKVCDKNLFVEVFNVNTFGVDADYLTDSVNFRKYIGDFDYEHENYSYACKGDSIFIIKTVNGNRWARDTIVDGRMTVVSNFDTIENLRFSLLQLKKLDNFK